MYEVQRYSSVLLFIWITSIVILGTSIYKNSNSNFFRIGPSNNLLFLGFDIDTYFKYYSFCSFCFINSCIRKINTEILNPWITLVIQDESKAKYKNIHLDAYIISNISNFYIWFDWILCINIMLTQIDIILVEMLADFIILNISTFRYLRNDKYDEITDKIVFKI